MDKKIKFWDGHSCPTYSLMKVGWLINDCLTTIPGTKTFWHDLLDWIPNLEDKTLGYTSFLTLTFRSKTS